MLFQKWKYHFLAWWLYLSYELLTGYFLGQENLFEFLCFGVVEIALFYAHFFLLNLLVGGTVRMTRWLPLAAVQLCSLLLFCCVFVGLRIVLNKWEENEMPLDFFNKRYWAGAIFRGLYYMGLSFGYWLLRRRVQDRDRMLRIEKEASEERRKSDQLELHLFRTQNAWLKASINPHLLYNTLSFIYSKFDPGGDAGKSIILLSKIMRYSLEEPEPDFMVPLEKEWEQVGNYIALQQLREEPRYVVNTFEHHGKDARIPPALLLTLVENIFMHGDVGQPETPASVFLKSGMEGWSLQIKNKKGVFRDIHRGYNIGLGNVTTRLDAAYGKNRYLLKTITDNPDTYFLTLSVYAVPKPDV